MTIEQALAGACHHLPALSFYGDASSKGSAYMVAGGFAVSGNRISEIEDKIATLRDDAGITSEFHWSDYRGGRKRSGYEALIRLAFDLINKRQAALHVIVAKFSGYNHGHSYGENKDTSVNRMYYQLFLHRICKFYGKKDESTLGWTPEMIVTTFVRCATNYVPTPSKNTTLRRTALERLSLLILKTLALSKWLT